MKRNFSTYATIIAIFGLISTSLVGCSNTSQEVKKETNPISEKALIPDKATAIKIAEAIWLPIYGKEVLEKRPFIAQLVNDVWVVEGSLPIGLKGGVPYIMIQKNDCKVLKVKHYK